MTERNNHSDRITKSEAAQVLGVTSRTIDRYLANGTLTPLKFHNGRVQIASSEVNALLIPLAPAETSPEVVSAGAFSIPPK